LFVANLGSDSVSVLSSETGAVEATVAVGGSPVAVAYDARTDNLYVTNFFTDNVSVISGRTNQVIATVPVGTGPVGITSDPANGEIYVANFNTPFASSENVTVISDSTNRPIASILMPGDGSARPYGIVYDATDSRVYVSSPYTDELFEIAPAANLLSGAVVLVASPWEIAWDSMNDLVYATDPITNQVLAVSGAAGIFLGSIGVGVDPDGIQSDAPRGTVLVANEGSDNVTIVNGTSDQVEANVPVGVAPWGLAVDPATGRVFVANSGSNCVSMLGGRSYSEEWTTVLGTAPSAIAYDPIDHAFYVADEDANHLVVINASSSTIVRTIPVGQFPDAVLYDAVTGKIYVSNANSDNLSVIDAVNGTVVGSIDLGGGTLPWSLAENPFTGDVYVSDLVNGRVLVINGSTGTIAGRVPTGQFPEGMVYDPRNDRLYVANFLSDNLTVIDPATLAPVGNVTLPSALGPMNLALDPLDGDLYVVSSYSNDIAVVDPSTNSMVEKLPVGYAPDAVGYDPTNGALYVANGGSNNLTVFNATTNSLQGSLPVGIAPVALAQDGISGEVYLANIGSGTITILGPARVATFPVTFVATGLPHGASWSVSLNGTTETSAGSTISFNESSGSYAYAVESSNTSFEAVPSSGTVSVSGAATRVAVNFYQVESSVEFTERGLASGTVWSVTLGSQRETVTTSSIVFSETNGNYGWSVGVPSGYAVSQPAGTVTVQGNSSTVFLSFVAVAAGQYPVRFNATGLPSGTNWTVTLGGGPGATTASSDGSSMVIFAEANGNYPYTVGAVAGYTATPSSGTVSVSGSSVTVAVTFRVVPRYSVTFTETGLPSGTDWSVTLDGISSSNRTSSVTFEEANGTYDYTVGVSDARWSPEPGSGTVTVRGSNRTVSVTFVETVYSVTFTETGLPSGSSWAVAIGSTGEYSAGGSIGFDEPNGTYSFSVFGPSGYRASPSSGTVTVSGSSVTITMTFASPASPAGPAVGELSRVTGAGGGVHRNPRWASDPEAASTAAVVRRA
jgi:YVTN family beta-propeller protein